MRNAHTRHLRLVSPHDTEMQILSFAEHVQADPVIVLKSIARSEMIGFACIFLALGFVVGALFAIGGSAS